MTEHGVDTASTAAPEPEPTHERTVIGAPPEPPAPPAAVAAVAKPAPRAPTPPRLAAPLAPARIDDEATRQSVQVPYTQAMRAWLLPAPGGSRVVAVREGEPMPAGAVEVTVVASAPSTDLIALLYGTGDDG